MSTDALQPFPRSLISCYLNGMFKINLSANRIDPVEKKSFSDLRLREREHLQEWIAHAPEALGEDLLIIQKEFSGFDGTQERLDLLALDMSGRLVIIENKLDDTGRDVIWQALKYAAYCSTLTTSQILDIFHRHLGSGTREDAAERLQEFLSDSDGEDPVLNLAGSQRIILVAANFRREVTATALWLLSKGLDITCFQVSPYQSGDDLFLDVSQIIPTPETADFMIQLAAKSATDEKATGAEAERHRRRRAYWDKLFETAARNGIQRYSSRSATKENWMTLTTGIRAVHLALVIKESEAMVQFNFETPDKLLNKALFDLARTHAAEIEKPFEEAIQWRRMDDSKASRIVIATACDFLDQSTWPETIGWQLDRLETLEKTIAPFLPEMSDLVRAS